MNDKTQNKIDEADECETFYHKIGRMNWLALSLEDLINKIGQDKLDDNDLNEWCVVADGLTEEWVMDRMNCRCSINEMIKYSLEDLEKIVDAKIEFLECFQKRLCKLDSENELKSEGNK